MAKILRVDANDDSTHNLLLEHDDGACWYYRKCVVTNVEFDMSLATDSHVMMVEKLEILPFKECD